MPRRKNKAENMALTNILLCLIIIVQIELAIMQNPAINDNNPKFFNIGGVLSNNGSEDHFRDTIAVRVFYFISMFNIILWENLLFVGFFFIFGLRIWLWTLFKTNLIERLKLHYLWAYCFGCPRVFISR